MNRLGFALALFALFLVGCGHSISKQELLTKYAAPPSKFIEINGTRIHYRDEGTGPTIILIHGVLSSLHTWEGWAQDLKKDHRIIRFDSPAFGLTGKMGNEQYDLENYLQLIEKLLSNIGAPKKFILVGNSLGGLFAWNYAALHPEQVEKLVLIDSAGYPQELPSILKLMINPIIRNIPYSVVPKFFIDRNVKTVYGDSNKITPETYELYYNINAFPGNQEASTKLFQYLDQLRDQDKTAPIKNLKMPVLVMWGEKDQWVPFNSKWKIDLPKAKYITYSGVGHIPMEEIPELTVKDFRNWDQETTKGNL